VSFLLDKIKNAWSKVMSSPPMEEEIATNKVEDCVNLVFEMAKLMQIDPQQIVDVMHERLEVLKMKKHDPDIEAIVKLHGGNPDV
jgi:hypothetical protein